MDAITPRIRETSDGTNRDILPQPIMDEDKDINESVGSRSITPLPSVEDPEEAFQIPTEESNRQDPERRLKEFRARHIQMMALGTFLRFSKLN
jgi:amino acid permease